jgi:hypothetical protein
MPVMDEGGFIIDYRSRPGTALSETDRLLQQVEAILKATPDVATWSRRTGLSLGGHISEANEGDFFVKLKSAGRRPIFAVMSEVRARIENEVPGLDAELAQLMEDLIGDLTAVITRTFWLRRHGRPPLESVKSGGLSRCATALTLRATLWMSALTGSKQLSKGSTLPKRRASPASSCAGRS